MTMKLLNCLYARSESRFERSDDKMVVEPVQPDPKKLGKQSSLMSAASAFSLAQETLGLTEVT